MFRHLQKYFLILLSLFLLPSTYAMENNESKLLVGYNEKATTELYELLDVLTDICEACGGGWGNHPEQKQYMKKDVENHIEKIKKLIAQKANPNITFGDESLLSLAMYNKPLFYYLLEHGANINIVADYGGTLISKYIYNHEFYNIQIEDLAKNEADLNAKDRLGEHSLLMAMHYGNLNMVKDLIKYGADVNQKCFRKTARYSSITPLATCISRSYCHEKKPDIIKTLCKAGASLHNVIEYNDESKNLKPYTAFHLAVEDFLPKKCLTALLIDTQDSHEQYQKSIERFITTLWVLGQRDIPQELACSILSNLPENHCPAGIIYSLLAKDFEKFSIYYPIRNHITKIQTILQQPNIHGTALEYLNSSEEDYHQNYHNLAMYDPNCIHDARKLLDPDVLENDYKEFLHTFPNLSKISPENLALQLYNNSYN